MSVEFMAQIKQIQMTIDACGDKGGKLVLVFRDENETLENLNKLMRMDEEVIVGIKAK